MQRVKIKSIEKIKNEDRYDLEVADNHNYFVNNILTHNCRVITVIEGNGQIKFYSRKGKEFLTLGKVKEAISKLKLANVVFDGEMCITDENGIEDFTSIIKLIRRKDFTIEEPKYKLFDYLSIDTFNNAAGGPTLSTRIEQLNKVIPENHPILDTLEQIKIKDLNHLTKLSSEAEANKREGLILRKDTLYEGKRTKDMLKVKKFHDAEYVVKDIEMGPIRYIENGKEKEEVMLSSVKIEHKSYTVSVGSGFSIDFRRKVYNNPKLIVGKTVLIKYFEETTNKHGGISLRFPTFVYCYDKKREV